MKVKIVTPNMCFKIRDILLLKIPFFKELLSGKYSEDKDQIIEAIEDNFLEEFLLHYFTNYKLSIDVDNYFEYVDFLKYLGVKDTSHVDNSIYLDISYKNILNVSIPKMEYILVRGILRIQLGEKVFMKWHYNNEDAYKYPIIKFYVNVIEEKGNLNEMRKIFMEYYQKDYCNSLYLMDKSNVEHFLKLLEYGNNETMDVFLHYFAEYKLFDYKLKVIKDILSVIFLDETYHPSEGVFTRFMEDLVYNHCYQDWEANIKRQLNTYSASTHSFYEEFQFIKFWILKIDYHDI